MFGVRTYVSCVFVVYDGVHSVSCGSPEWCINPFHCSVYAHIALLMYTQLPLPGHGLCGT